jgi:hypothetical protein
MLSIKLDQRMTYKFLSRPFEDGAYEPEGIYLSSPLAGNCLAVQLWGDNSGHYAQFTYNGIPMKGHNGIDFLVAPGTSVLAVDPGRVTEIGEERGGIGRYLKLEHRWGESLYAHVDAILLDAGQQVERGAAIAVVGDLDLMAALDRQKGGSTYFHFAIRIKPFNRFDGWGGFVDPLPYLNPAQLQFVADQLPEAVPTFTPHAMVREQRNSRRP